MAPTVGYRRLEQGTQPEYLHPAYVSSVKRAPTKPLVVVPHTISEITGPIFDEETLAARKIAAQGLDLTLVDGGEALGERVIVSGRVLDEDGRAVAHTLVEIWQANAAGR